MRLVIFLCLALGVSCVPAGAELTSQALRSYNEAVASNDNSAIKSAALTLMKEAISDPKNPNATVAAYEASVKLCERGECEAALPGANFVLKQPDTGGHPVKADRDLLKAFAEHQKKSTNGTRKDLKNALSDVRGKDPSFLSLRADLVLMNDFYSRGDWSETNEIARESVAQLANVKSSVPEGYYSAREYRATTGLLRGKTQNAQSDLYRLHAELKQQMSRYYAEGIAPPEWLVRVYWRVEAWRLGLDVYFEAYSTRGSLGSYRAGEGSEKPLNKTAISAIADEYPLVAGGGIPGDNLDDPRPICEGEWVRGKEIRYPGFEAFEAIVGAIVVRLELDEDGKVLSPEVLATVPGGGFDDEVINAVSTWRYARTDDSAPGCRLKQNNVIWRVTFSVSGFGQRKY
ncbi:MAG: hypothetical protein CMK09_04400 [Ponticaulis sp.]|nr:hypothetical protein [Ponticaulis sp.]|tara:strand:+ start:22595 stop:23800 length:1206 start_codon:yes stop_codon:yes gene_type:complete